MNSPTRVHILGAVSAVAFALHTVASWRLAPHLPVRAGGDDASVIVAWLQALGLEAVRAPAWVPSPATQFQLYVVPLTLSTAAFVLVLFQLVRASGIDEATVRQIRRWAIVFALQSAPAMPVIVEDFWLSIAWGRMTASGTNPYSIVGDGDFTAGLPMETTGMPMTYGPLWALVSAAISSIAGGNALGAAILFKALLTAVWIAVVILVCRISASEGTRSQAVATAAVGWLPAGVHLAVAEGHNDAAMILGALGWLYFVQRGSRFSSLALAVGSLVKYITLPLFLVDALQWRPWTRAALRPWLLQMAATAVAGIAVTALVVRSTDFLDAANAMRAWNFWRPEDAAMAMASMAHLPREPAAWIVRLAIAAITVWALVGAARDRGLRSIAHASLCVLGVILFLGVGHVWPWFLIWVLPFAALCHRTHVARYLTGVAIAAPYVILPWTFAVGSDGVTYDLAAVVLYVVAALWWWLGPVNRDAA